MKFYSLLAEKIKTITVMKAYEREIFNYLENMEPYNISVNIFCLMEFCKFLIYLYL